MHGLVNCAIQQFLQDTYGAETWVQVRDQAGLPFDQFDAMLHYDPALTTLTLDAACTLLHRDDLSLLEDLGTWMVSHPSQGAIRRLLRFGGTDFPEFLHTLEELPGRAGMALPDLDMPGLSLREVGPSAFLLKLTWELPGIGAVFLGALRAMADDYGALVLLAPQSAEPGHETLLIEVLAADFAAGRGFALAASQ